MLVGTGRSTEKGVRRAAVFMGTAGSTEGCSVYGHWGEHGEGGDGESGRHQHGRQHGIRGSE